MTKSKNSSACFVFQDTCYRQNPAFRQRLQSCAGFNRFTNPNQERYDLKNTQYQAGHRGLHKIVTPQTPKAFYQGIAAQARGQGCICREPDLVVTQGRFDLSSVSKDFVTTFAQSILRKQQVPTWLQGSKMTLD